MGTETERGFVPCGTGFIGIAIYEDVAAPMIITARHVIDMIRGDQFSIRLNRKDGSSECRRLSKENMIVFENRAIDLAVIPAPIDHSIYDVFAIHIDSEKWKKQIDDAGLGFPSPGDEISIVGLYTTHFGQVKNMPIIRIGHIAANPEEEVLTYRGYVKGFLVEVHSIAGLSGSPVFWNLPVVRVVNEELQYLPAVMQIPIGIFIGYHCTDTREDQILVPEFQPPPGEWEEKEESEKRPSEERRTGFGVVLPIQFIFGIFEGDQMREILKKAVEEHRKGSGFRPASAPVDTQVSAPISAKVVPPSIDANPTHREDFRRLVDVAARKPAPKD